jgi:hypothetical protein
VVVSGRNVSDLYCALYVDMRVTGRIRIQVARTQVCGEMTSSFG